MQPVQRSRFYFDEDASTSAETSLGSGIPDVTMGTDSQDEEVDVMEEMYMSADEVVETAGGKQKKNKAISFSAFQTFRSAFFQRFHHRGDFPHLKEGLRQSTSV